MDPREALDRSDLRSIRTGVSDAVAIIRQSSARTGPFHARLVRRDGNGQLGMEAMQVIGDFPTLADAVRAVEEAAGSKIEAWQPEIGVDLRLGDEGGMEPGGTA